MRSVEKLKVPLGNLLWTSGNKVWTRGVSLWERGVSLLERGVSLLEDGVSLLAEGNKVWMGGISLWASGVSLRMAGVSLRTGGVSLLVGGASMLEGGFSNSAVGEWLYAKREEVSGMREWVLSFNGALLSEGKLLVESDASARKVGTLVLSKSERMPDSVALEVAFGAEEVCPVSGESKFDSRVSAIGECAHQKDESGCGRDEYHVPSALL